MADNSITVVGNVTRDPELKFLNSGQAALRLSIAVNRRWLNRQTQEWDEKVSYFEVAGYGPMAENAANSLQKGTRVIVTGRLEQRSWETENGDKRSIVEINADEIAPSLRFATAVVTKTPRPEGGYQSGDRPQSSRPTETPTYAFDEEPF
ncbi:MAG: single-stranded DNA-binding protein [Acidobacteriota bacterium]|jgi:single-strand DNA-binding protein|nr:single-stranded DNA-binding protein [Acidobacteriota bacterium]MDE3043660.1 single-stranded DNA-binding protein [Acidobacteriota bacterium]MDE3106874.1 single-stranded DNA-binding protein [Acidobacteriota bacterium]MDE3222146.1 single-stranded DNA-binding protein [Acidobacteriota bacterium]